VTAGKHGSQAGKHDGIDRYQSNNGKRHQEAMKSDKPGSSKGSSATDETACMSDVGNNMYINKWWGGGQVSGGQAWWLEI